MDEKSHHGVKRITSTMFQQALDYCINSAASGSSVTLIELLESAYMLYAGLRSRAFFRAHFSRQFGLAFEAAYRAQRALLFLCRFYAAVSTFTEAASWIPSFRQISVECVQPFKAVAGVEGKRSMTISNALKGARVPKSAKLIRYRFEGTVEDITKRGTKLRSHLGTGGDIVEIIN